MTKDNTKARVDRINKVAKEKGTKAAQAQFMKEISNILGK